MPAVKRPGHSIVKGTRLKIAGKHARPCDSLQQRPVCAESGDKRTNNNKFAQP